jgi:hypothetical protein
MKLDGNQFAIGEPLSLNVGDVHVAVTVVAIHLTQSTVSYDVQWGGLLLRQIHASYLSVPKSALAAQSSKAYAPT